MYKVKFVFADNVREIGMVFEGDYVFFGMWSNWLEMFVRKLRVRSIEEIQSYFENFIRCNLFWFGEVYVWGVCSFQIINICSFFLISDVFRFFGVQFVQ